MLMLMVYKHLVTMAVRDQQLVPTTHSQPTSVCSCFFFLICIIYFIIVIGTPLGML